MRSRRSGLALIDIAGDVGETIARARALAEQIDRPEYLVPLLSLALQVDLGCLDARVSQPLLEIVDRAG
jgi:hypothetical protein